MFKEVVEKGVDLPGRFTENAPQKASESRWV
jgi:hypothetical protein